MKSISSRLPSPVPRPSPMDSGKWEEEESWFTEILVPEALRCHCSMQSNVKYFRNIGDLIYYVDQRSSSFEYLSENELLRNLKMRYK